MSALPCWGGPGVLLGGLCSSARALLGATALALLRLGASLIPFVFHPPSLCFASDTAWVPAALPAASPSTPLLSRGCRLQCAPPQQAAAARGWRGTRYERRQHRRRGIHSARDGWLETEEALPYVSFIRLVSGEEEPLAFANKVKQFPVLLALTYFSPQQKNSLLISWSVQKLMRCCSA